MYWCLESYLIDFNSQNLILGKIVDASAKTVLRSVMDGLHVISIEMPGGRVHISEFSEYLFCNKYDVATSLKYFATDVMFVFNSVMSLLSIHAFHTS